MIDFIISLLISYVIFAILTKIKFGILLYFVVGVLGNILTISIAREKETILKFIEQQYLLTGQRIEISDTAIKLSILMSVCYRSIFWPGHIIGLLATTIVHKKEI